MRETQHLTTAKIQIHFTSCFSRSMLPFYIFHFETKRHYKQQKWEAKKKKLYSVFAWISPRPTGSAIRLCWRCVRYKSIHFLLLWLLDFAYMLNSEMVCEFSCSKCMFLMIWTIDTFARTTCMLLVRLVLLEPVDHCFIRISNFNVRTLQSDGTIYRMCLLFLVPSLSQWEREREKMQ